MGYSHSDHPQPFDGYYYKMLTAQGDAAKGGAKDYLSNGKLTGGFGVLAWPAKYRDSGIMSFMVGEDGLVYQKDLGEKTSELAPSITSYNPGDGWNVVLLLGRCELPCLPAREKVTLKCGACSTSLLGPQSRLELRQLAVL